MNTSGMLPYIFIPIVISFVFGMGRRRAAIKTSEMKINNFVARLPGWMLGVAVVCETFLATLFIVMMTVGYNDTVTTPVILGFLGFNLLGLFMIYIVLREKLIVVGNDFTYYPIFGRKRVFTLKDIEYKKGPRTANSSMPTVRFYSNTRKLFDINPMSIGYSLIMTKTAKIPYKD